MSRFVILSGCSGGGKSTLLAELEQRGYPIVEEPGRRLIRAEIQRNGAALPWIDLKAFLHQTMAMALDGLASLHEQDNWVFFDRGWIDAAIALQHISGEAALTTPG
ncbi:AAA family ATPase [Chromobacterium alticapitis]|uniref:AAA family ATPase n=1 Tax=Chromobacterium alticapitis TaxID=2073169 RepID=UPI00210149C0|nr:AAA family ATPase [Chromobacterium alticapitis]